MVIFHSHVRPEGYPHGPSHGLHLRLSSRFHEGHGQSEVVGDLPKTPWILPTKMSFVVSLMIHGLQEYVQDFHIMCVYIYIHNIYIYI